MLTAAQRKRARVWPQPGSAAPFSRALDWRFPPTGLEQPAVIMPPPPPSDEYIAELEATIEYHKARLRRALQRRT